MEGLLQRQQIIAEAIDKVGINFNKDSDLRKTSEYLKKRVDAIDERWHEFEANNTKLLNFEIKTTGYVTSNAYERVKSRYEQIRNTILSYPVRNEDKGTPSRSDELILQQLTNFRALSRLIRNIDIESISEKWEIEDKLQMLQARWKIIDEVHWQIDNLLIDSNLDYEQEFTNNETKYESVKRQLNRKLNATTSQNQSLPKIEIPTFSGSYAQWPTFLDLYTETIHNNMSLSNAQKMQHLKGKLRGEAERLVQHLTVSADNYNTCWEILTHRYDNKQLLFTKQIQAFMSQAAVQHQSAYELKRLHDTSMETIHAVHNLGVDTTTWDPILVHILTGKLDSDTYTSYMESRKAPRDLPVLDEFMEFLENKFTALEPVNKKKQQPNLMSTKPNNFPAREASVSSPKGAQHKHIRAQPRTYHVNAERSCPLCKTSHILINCKTFYDMSPETKLQTISQLKICQNCLYSHDKQCTSKKTCRVCNLPHHTSLHDTLRVAKQISPSTSGQQPSQSQYNQFTTAQQPSTNHVAGNYNEVLLATLQLQVKAVDGTYITLRCLLDQGSQINLITESAAQRLGLPRSHENASVFGIGKSANQSKGTVQLNCTSLNGDYKFNTDALVMTKVLNNLPNFSFEKQEWPHLRGIYLADPEYNVSRPVDILLDAGVYAEIATGCMLRGPADAPVALQTKVGWVLLGNMKTYNCHATMHNIEEISQFWELEDITFTNNSKQMTSDEARCETLYANSTRRLGNGRYEVKIPMKQNYEHNLGASKSQAVAQFRQLEKRLTKNKELSDSYKAFIAEYVSLGHMKQSTELRELSCFLPHHGVLRPESTTTKLRVVFNASSNTSSGYSLNQLMECGPNLQQDLQAMILRWRSYQYVYTADIEKFYRQILIAEEDQHLQKIVWRDSTFEQIKEFQLCTVTYGTKAAPFLAMRTIKQLIMDDGKNYPLAAEILDHQLYVDDLLAGSNSIEEAQSAQSQLIVMLRGGGFNIRKWTSNKPTLLENLSEDLISQNMFNFQQAESNKTLGISWNPQTDHFTFRHNTNTNDDVTTKRSLLSELSKLYDPLGWLSPVTMKAKIMFQRAWKTTPSWDEPLPECVQQEWEQFRKELPTIQNITIPRWIGNTQQNIELHGFSDASEKAYACVIYCITVGEQGEKVIQLVAGKTKLAPLNKPITLPRLELCGALLLARLMKKVVESIKAQTVTVHGWTDSMVVLGWLHGEPSRWKTFVANRVIQITELMPTSCWRHVKSEDNAADCASRGLCPSQLLSCSIWWEGPIWLKSNELPPENNFETREEERKQPQVSITQSSALLVEEILQTHSSMSRVIRVLSWIIRFIKNARDKNNANRSSHLTTHELRSTLNVIMKAVQRESFIDEISQLQKQNRVSSSSKIINLNPILDKDGLLRVGGRLEKADLDHTQKHPIIIPNNHKLTELLIEQAHKTTLHGGARVTLQCLRTRYWIIGGMRTVKRCITKCVKCHRYSKQNTNQLMADLPAPRVNPSRPFTHTGVDFTGQVEVKANKGRGIKTTKAYIAVFICLCTKAIHLELVADLSTAAFIAALKRLCARRGAPKHMYSDNGTNFVGAAKTLAKERKEAGNTTRKPSTPQQRSKKGVFFNYLCTLLLLTTMCITPAAPQPVNVTTLNPEKLIYFDKLTDMKIIQDKWTMVVYYNMSTYWQSFHNLAEYISYFKGLCTHEVECQALVTQFEHELNELKHYNDMLQTEHGRRRTRRGLIDGVGYVANSLFGVLDERFAEKYHKDIKKIQFNENHLLNLYKNHTSIIEGEYNLLKRNEEVFNKQFIAINLNLEEVKNMVRQDHSKIQYVTLTALAANMILSNLRNVQQLLLDLVTDIRSGRVDTHMLKPEEFETQLNIISRQIPNGLTLPCTNSYECTRLMYKISRVRVRLTSYYLIFEVKIPLVATELYELSRVLPINMNQGKTLIHVVPTTEYIAVDQKRNLLITITSKDILSQCLHANEHLLLCNINLPIYDIKTTQSICEAQIIGRKPATSCRTAVSDCRVEWTQLHNRSSWLFTCCEECTTSIFCPAEDVTSQVLRNTGIVSLPDGCMLQGADHVINAHVNLHSEVHLKEDYNTYIPHSGINKFLAVNNITSINFSREPHDEQLRILKDKIESVKSQQEIRDLTDTDDIHHYIMYGFMTLCALLGLGLGLKGYQRRKRQRSNEIEDNELATIAAASTAPSHPTSTSNYDVTETAVKVDKATSPALYRSKN